jgi:hypothetical protein
MPIRIESNRKYERFRHTTAESKFLASKGFQTVTSSNVSAVGKDKATLLVRFHGGATYGYPKSGSLFDSMLKSASKGKFVWRELIRKKVPYYKTTAKILKNDIDSRDMMKEAEKLEAQTPEEDSIELKKIKKPKIETLAKPEEIKKVTTKAVAPTKATPTIIKPKVINIKDLKLKVPPTIIIPQIVTTSLGKSILVGLALGVALESSIVDLNVARLINNTPIRAVR